MRRVKFVFAQSPIGGSNGVEMNGIDLVSIWQRERIVGNNLLALEVTIIMRLLSAHSSSVLSRQF